MLLVISFSACKLIWYDPLSFICGVDWLSKIHVGRLQKKLYDIPPEGIMWRNCRQWMKQSFWQLWDVRKICFFLCLRAVREISFLFSTWFIKNWFKNLFKTPVYHFIKWYTKKHLWIFQKLYEFLKNIPKLKRYIYVIDLDIWLSGCQAINEHL